MKSNSYASWQGASEAFASWATYVVVSGGCLVSRKGRARFWSPAGFQRNQYSFRFELIQRWERWGAAWFLHAL